MTYCVTKKTFKMVIPNQISNKLLQGYFPSIYCVTWSRGAKESEIYAFIKIQSMELESVH